MKYGESFFTSNVFYWIHLKNEEKGVLRCVQLRTSEKAIFANEKGKDRLLNFLNEPYMMYGK